MNNSTLRGRLTFITLGIFFVAWLLMLSIVMVMNYGRYMEDIETQLADEIGNIAEEVTFQLSGGNDVPFGEGMKQYFEWTNTMVDQVQVFRDGKLYWSNNPQLPNYLSNEAGFVESLPPSLDAWQDWTAYHYPMPDANISLMVWFDFSNEDQLGEILFDVLLPLMSILPLALLAIHFGIGRALRPMLKLKQDIESRSPHNLAMIANDGLPEELHPMIGATNQLFLRVQSLLERQDEALEKERKFTANAAHELLTPLTAIKSEVDLCSRQYGEQDPQLSQVMGEIRSRVDRATHIIEQLVTLARMDPQPKESEVFKPVNLTELVQEVAADLGDSWEEKHLDFELIADDDATISGLAVPLGVLARNLLDNAIKYTPESGQIRCFINRSGQTIELRVENSAPPLPDYLKGHIFDRFVRGPGEKNSGSGLGLSIVKQIAQLHHGEVTLDNLPRGDGVEVKVRFNAAG